MEEYIECRYKAGDTVVFFNQSITGYIGRDGQPCQIESIKARKDWASSVLNTAPVPEYNIRFHDGHGFGARETELQP